MKERFSCFIIGDGSLTIRCADILQKEGHEIRGIITSNRDVKFWASANGSPHLDYSLDVLAAMREQPFDYLFSIVNMRLLPGEMVALPRRGAINFHDGPLPRYAGVNATSWALMNRERTHGVTWHFIGAIIDGGQILKQDHFQVSENETAYSLNMMCFEAGAQAFSALVWELAEGTARPREQDLRHRNYRGMYERPPAACVISWQNGADEIAAFIRALEFGPIANPFGRAKVFLNGEFFLCPEALVDEVQAGELSGTILEAGSSGLRISTAKGAITFRQLLTLHGQPAPLSEVRDRCQLRIGLILPDWDATLANRATKLNDELCRHESFWVQRLQALQAVSIPYLDPARQADHSANCATFDMTVPETVSSFLADRPSWNPAEFLLMAFAVYLSRIATESKFDLGISLPAVKDELVGMGSLFSTVVPLPINVDFDRSFSAQYPDMLAQLDLARQHKTFLHDVVARYPELRSLASQGFHKLLPVCLDLVETFNDSSPATDAKLCIMVTHDPRQCRWIFNRTALSDSQIRLMVGQFTTFLTGVAADSDCAVKSLPVLSEAERHELLETWNATDTATAILAGLSINGYFERQVEDTPDAVAVVCRDQKLTYRELNVRANQLARYLRKSGVGPEIMVGIAADRSVEMVVGLLGILKAGGAYVPMDPTYPKDRIAFMLEDSKAALLVTQQSLLSRLPNQQVSLVCLDADWPEIARENSDNVDSGVEPRNLAYVIYTSGSTGKPKGVMVEHRNVTNFFTGMDQRIGEEPGVWLAVTSISFDISVLELFWTLARGFKVVLVTDEDRMAAPQPPRRKVSPGRSLDHDCSLVSQTKAHGVTHLQCTPSLARMIADQPGGIEIMTGLKRLMLGGEALPDDLLSRLRPVVRGEIHNMYGPTETTVWSTTDQMAPQEDFITIGKPIANTQVYVVDRYGQPVPVGIPGELLIGGDGVTRGYLNREDLTRERFVPNPFHAEHNNNRLYRTGDLVAWRSDGRIDFLGRLDDQVKIRGHRIELSEIEYVVTRHDAVCGAAVVSRLRTNGEAELVAFYLTHPGQNIDAQEFRTTLSRHLPDYMLPAAFVRLDKLPTTPNGKVDRKALAAMQVTMEASHRSVREGPRNSVEEALLRIFENVLGHQTVGIHDNLFDLGGNSLSATQVISRISKELSVEIEFRNFFDAPTAAKLADLILACSSNVSEVPPIGRVPRTEELPLSFAQQRLWFLTQLEPDSPLYNIPIAIRLNGVPELPVLEQSLNTIVQRHEVLRTTFCTVDGKPAQIIASSLELKIEVCAVPEIPEPSRTKEIRRLAFEEARRPFDFVNGPLIRAVLLRESVTRHVLLLTVHHLVADGWSTEVLYRELGTLYRSFSKGQPSPLPALRVQYADYALWQRRWLQGEVLESQLGYWKKKLAQPLPVSQLPTDRRRPAAGSFNGGNETLLLPKTLSESLRVLSQREEVTLFMLLLAAYNVLLFRYSGQQDILVGTPIANRNRSELEGLIGFFANTLVIRTDLSGNPSFRKLLSRVREEAIGAFAHQDLPFEKLVEELQPERDPSRNPLFQVLLAMQNVPAAPLDLGELAVSRLEESGGTSKSHMEVDNGTSKFDLSLYALERPEGISFTFEYNTDLFNSDRMQRMLYHLQVLLESIIENPEEQIATLPLLSSAEKTELLATCSRGVDYPSDQCVHHVFEIQAQRTPNAIAVVFEKQRATYQQLNEKANRLAHYLRSLGVGPEILVGLFMERSLETVVGILAVLKAGGAYLPMDPQYPADRLAFMLEDARAAVLLTETKLLDSLPGHSVRTICLDDTEAVLRAQPMTNPAIPVAPENMAYVIYTSGSTGKPKGCIITHRNVARLMRATEACYGFNERDVWTLFHSFAFDFSVWEIWGALLYGGRLVVVPFLVSRSPDEFYELLAEEQVTVLNQTPSAFRQLIQAEESVGQKKLALRYVIFGGEALEMQSLRPWFERHGDQHPRLVNMYGITETTVHVTYRPLSKDDLDSGSVVGKPIPDLQVYMLDSKRQPVPVGVMGEMFVAGAGLARGYLYRPELTMERFMPDHLTGKPGSRLYKTGDLARFLEDGDIEYLGRIDDQVKIRGFRIELGEIEASLYQHPAVQQAAVIIREDTPGDKRLAAYVVMNPGYESDASRATTHSDYLDGWQAVFDQTYADTVTAPDHTFSITGWNSSYNGRPIPADEMRTWVDTTVERIVALQPQDVWEIGCGTGLLLYRLAPLCANYYATDFSAEVIRTLQQQIAQHRPASTRVVLHHASADDFTGTSAESFNVVILNSIVQYFPSIDYFMSVLEGAVRTVKPGGAIFLGDVRSYGLLEAFHAAVQLEQAPASLPCADLRQRIKKSLIQEKELTISPGFFSALRDRVPAISQVEIQLKRGYHHNELGQFRYDVVLRIGGSIRFTPNSARIDWREGGFSLSDLREYLLKEKPAAVTITGVPNARLETELKTLETLASANCPGTVAELREAARMASVSDAMEPEDFWVLGDALCYVVQVRWSNRAREGSYDVVFLRRGEAINGLSNSVFNFVDETDGALKPLGTYANDPLQGMFVRNLAPQLRTMLEKKLPEYMVPSSYMLMDSFPLTPNGKLDRVALPAPDSSWPVNQHDYVAPRNGTEETLAGLWADILALDRVSVHDNFFELGGHSLLASQLISRIRGILGVNPPLRSLFENPTVAGYADYVEAIRWTSAKPPASIADAVDFEEGEL